MTITGIYVYKNKRNLCTNLQEILYASLYAQHEVWFELWVLPQEEMWKEPEINREGEKKILENALFLDNFFKF